MRKPDTIKTSAIAVIIAFSLGSGGCASMRKTSYPDAADTSANVIKKKRKITASISGRVMVDYANTHAENANFDMNDLELRRAYLGVGGKIGKRVGYSLSGSISETGDIGLVGATVDWKPAGTNLKFRAGQFKTPMSLDESTSSKYTSVFERAAFTDAVEIDRRLGLGVFHTGKKHTLAAGVFGGNIEHQPFSSGMAYAARATYVPLKKKDRLAHLGASVRYRTNNKDEGNIRYRQRPYTHVSERIISTGRIAESDVVVGAEAAIINENFWAAGEYNVTYANCSTCISDPNFKGYYTEAGLFFGGRKTYSGGSFGRPKVNKPVNKGGPGAVSFVARYDRVDLDNGSVNGGDLDTTILGADWYPTDHTRIGINYFNGSAGLGNRKSGLGPEFNKLRKSKAITETVNGFIIRAQYDF